MDFPGAYSSATLLGAYRIVARECDGLKELLLGYLVPERFSDMLSL